MYGLCMLNRKITPNSSWYTKCIDYGPYHLQITDAISSNVVLSCTCELFDTITTTFPLSSLNDLEVMQCIGNIDPRVIWSLVQLSLWFPVILFSFAYRINVARVVLSYAMSNTFLPNVNVAVRCVIRLEIMPCLNTVIFSCFALPMFVLMQLQKYCVIARYLRNRFIAAM